MPTYTVYILTPAEEWNHVDAPNEAAAIAQCSTEGTDITPDCLRLWHAVKEDEPTDDGDDPQAQPNEDDPRLADR